MSKPLNTVLTIDDDNDIRMIASMVLKKKGGFDVIAKESGSAALEYLEATAESDLPDLILLDVMMPGMDGPQTLEAIKQKAPHPIAKIPVMFMTAKCQPDEVERLKAAGAINVISKPFEVATLADQVRQYWNDIDA